MNEESIRQMIREEIKTVINERPDVGLVVSYDMFKRELTKALKKTGAPDELIKAAYEDADDVVERFYDEMKSELNALRPEEEFSEMPLIVGFACIDIIDKLGGGDDELGEKVAEIMTGGSFDSAANDAAWRDKNG